MRRKAEGRKGKGKNVPEAIRDSDSDESAEQRTRSPPGNRNPGIDDIEMAPPEIFAQADPHPDSPAACGTSPEERFGYLKRLSGNGHYGELLDMVGAEVCLPCIIVDRLLTHHSDKLWTHRWFSLVGFLVLP